MEAILQMILALIWLPLTIWVIWKLFVIVGDMAERRGQSRMLWMVVALFVNPLSAMVLLWLFCPSRAPDAVGLAGWGDFFCKKSLCGLKRWKPRPARDR